MGQDKALLPFLGQPLIKRIIARMGTIADEIIITTNQPEHFTFLERSLFPDALPGRGALGGLYTALLRATHPLVAIVACDMPFANPGLLAYQAQLLRDDETADIAIPRTPDGFEPLHAVYRRETCLPAAEWALAHDQWKIISWFPRVSVREVSSAEYQKHDPQGLAFSNINTPQELLEAEQQAQEMF